MDSAPRSKKARTKSSSRKSETKSTPTRADEVLLDSEETIVTAPKNTRYAESSSLAIHSGVELGQDEVMDDVLATREAEGTLDANLAELSLGQRLAAIAADNAKPGNVESDDEVASSRGQKRPSVPNVIPAHSLTRTLIQALHSSDSRLLETCLNHSDTSLIRNTVRRLPPQLCLPLLLACVERLARGARAANMKGGGGGASSQRAMMLITWIKTTLTVHSSHLITMPDLVARLAGLHATLTSRLALQDSLLSLNGKLDMVLSQIEMRSSSAPAPLKLKKDGDSLPDRARQPTRYVEGESENEDADTEEVAAEPVIESDGEEGSIEDIELGGESGEEDDAEEGVESSEGEEDSDSGGSAPALNGFIDDEAEEFDDDEDEDDESE
ncbi:hypothetical protein PISMIDRAFT_87254 [Pisolithus microcarpus 441]|uniref:Small-subunit processome Utp12 domain-containing protein n=1 Tax=Pisolithus microcarpus 441 TaxID=765257 RepID=A0A0D0AEP5_9AGAM|nr:hypothetical protein PISMIDRAFT_87254 [Pisolithus microcarpus 441]